jgi:tRNA A-37 threonylcarbamoyl transferase component Bud32
LTEQEFAPGTTLFGVYEVLGVLGGGGMGRVYKARHNQLNERRAIKVIRPDLTQEPGIKQTLVAEAKALRKVDHPAVAEYYELLADSEGRSYLVMEFVEGPTLEKILQTGALDAPSVLALWRRIGEGLEAVHVKGVVHRDISPANIVLPGGKPENAKLIDFGIASHAAGVTVDFTRFMATFAYASPEQLGQYGGKVDRRTDIYSLGLVLAEAASGEKAYRTPFETRVSAKVPSALRESIDKLLEPDPALRPETALGVIPELRSQPARVAQRQPNARKVREGGGRRAVVLLGLMLALMGVAAGVWTVRDTVSSWFDGGVWTDPATGLTWTLRDNGSDFNWNQATSYCRNLQLGGYSDWRPPEIAELEGIYDASQASHVKGGIHLSAVPWYWSATEGRSGSAWNFGFVRGKREQNITASYGGLRAICVRGAAPSTMLVSQPQPEAASTTPPPAGNSSGAAQGAAGVPGGTWADPTTGLTWPLHDNGSDVTWSNAVNYCRNLRLDVHSDWRLPELAELKGIYDASQPHNVKGGIQLTHWWYWTATVAAPSVSRRKKEKEARSGPAWNFGFSVGEGEPPGSAASVNRVLCVRGAAAPKPVNAAVQVSPAEPAHSMPPPRNPAYSTPAPRSGSAIPEGTWVDPATRLMWALHDNGAYVTRKKAVDYCRNLTLGGYTDWRLPEIGQLEGIYDASQNHVKGGIQLTLQFYWSATEGRSGSAWSFDFLHGERGQLAPDNYFYCALCVRKSEK